VNSILAHAGRQQTTDQVHGVRFGEKPMNGISKTRKMFYYSASDGPCLKLTGKTFDRIIVDEMDAGNKKIKWKKSGRLGLRAYQDDQFLGLSHNDMNPISQWCLTNNCGRRMSFDIFQFRNQKEIAMFLLKWA
jgi:hypothetical protein